MAVSSGALGFVFPTSGGLGDERIDQQLVLDALNMALGQWRPQPGLIHHTDQGRQYSSTAYVEMLKKQAMVQSMSRRANCYDNGEINRVYHCDKCVITRPGPSGYTGAMATAHFVAVTAALLAGWMAVRAKGRFNWSDPNARWRLGGFQRFERSAVIERLERLEQMF